MSMSQCNYLSIRAASLSDTQTHTHTFQCLSFQQFVLTRTCVSLYGPHFEYLLGYSLPVIRQQSFLPCSIVFVCVHNTSTHNQTEKERETHTVTDSDREEDTFTHILSHTHTLSLCLSFSPSLSSRSCSIFLDLSSVTENWKELCRMPDHCYVITPPRDIL